MIGNAWGNVFSINNTNTGISQVAGQVHQLVWKYVISGGSADAYLWIDPSDASSEATLGSPDSSLTGQSWADSAVVYFGVQRYGNQNIIFD